MSHSSSPGRGAKRRQGQGTDRAFGDLAVIGEIHIRQPRGARQPGICGLDGRKDRCAPFGLGSQVRSGSQRDLLRRAAQSRHHMNTGLCLPIGDKPLPPVPQGPFRHAWCRSSAHRCSEQAPTVQTARRAGRNTACLPASSQAHWQRERKAGGSGKRDPLLGGQIAHQTAARAKPERIARGQHHYVAPARGQHRGGGKRHWPRLAFAPRHPTNSRWRGPPKIISASAKADRLASDSPLRPSSPNPTMVKPRFRHAKHPSSGRHNRSLATGAAPCRAAHGRASGPCFPMRAVPRARCQQPSAPAAGRVRRCRRACRLHPPRRLSPMWSTPPIPLPRR